MINDDCVDALVHIRRLRGGSQPILVRASDGFFYVVKFLNNLQGPNLLFNEAVGNELFSGVGLPVAEWRTVRISEEFLDRYPECWMETEYGLRKPRAGLCFGSRFLSLRNTPIFEILPGTSFNRIRNRRDFWTAWVLDALCRHADNRQAVFIERNSRSISAFFVDHGHLFGGASGTASPSFVVSRYLDSRVYTDVSARDVRDIERAIQCLDLELLTAVARNLPEGWGTESALLNFENFKSRITDAVLLKKIIQFILVQAGHAEIKARYAEGNHERGPARSTIEFHGADMRSKILPLRDNSRIDRWRRDLVGDIGCFGAQAVRPALGQAAGL
jgi:hypothetical protein